LKYGDARGHGSVEQPRALPLGRMFVNPAFDFLLSGGGLSLLVGAVAWAGGLRLTQDHVPAILVCLAPFGWALLRPQGGIGVTLKHLGIVAPLPLEHLRVGVSMGLSAWRWRRRSWCSSCYGAAAGRCH
jgi:hypothetical protein